MNEYMNVDNKKGKPVNKRVRGQGITQPKFSIFLTNSSASRLVLEPVDVDIGLISYTWT